MFIVKTLIQILALLPMLCVCEKLDCVLWPDTVLSCYWLDCRTQHAVKGNWIKPSDSFPERRLLWLQVGHG